MKPGILTARIPAKLDTFTMLPFVFNKWGTANWVKTKTDFTLTSITTSKSSTLESSMPPCFKMPALLTWEEKHTVHVDHHHIRCILYRKKEEISPCTLKWLKIPQFISFTQIATDLIFICLLFFDNIIKYCAVRKFYHLTKYLGIFKPVDIH